LSVKSEVFPMVSFQILNSVKADSLVRMLFKSGYKNVYVSRQFAIKNGMVDAKVSTPYMQ
jgi:hypothetical protein